MLYHFDVLESTIVDGKFEENTLFDLINLKHIYKRWRDAVDEKGWLANALGNHDFARMTSRFGNDKEFWLESSKMLLIMQATQNGTLNIYQGDEIGMTNINLNTIEEVRDVQSLNFYNENLQTQRYSAEMALQMINKEGRDNARTPMQWSDEVNGGFSIKEPWLKSNPNYTKINVKQQQNDDDSILNFYRHLLSVRKEHDVFVFGDFEEIEFENPELYVYRKTLGTQKILVVLNFKDKNNSLIVKETISEKDIIINNYKQLNIDKNTLHIAPYQGVIIQCK